MLGGSAHKIKFSKIKLYTPLKLLLVIELILFSERSSSFSVPPTCLNSLFLIKVKPQLVIITFSTPSQPELPVLQFYKHKNALSIYFGNLIIQLITIGTYETTELIHSR